MTTIETQIQNRLATFTQELLGLVRAELVQALGVEPQPAQPVRSRAVTATAPSDLSARVLETIRTAPLPASAIATKLRAPKPAVRAILQREREAGRVKMQGRKRGAKYIAA